MISEFVDDLSIRKINVKDTHSICEIYNYYVASTIATFETEEISVGEMTRRITDRRSDYPWLVGEQRGRVVGYCYAAPWKLRNAYRNTVETTIYLDKECMGKGVGTVLYSKLLSNLQHFRAVIGGIALPNEASVKLHEKLGFKKVAHLIEVGYKFDRWIDVGYWEYIKRDV